ncbi:GGDEF domain-containing protein [Marinicella litoralis]|uniref:diguanylate cyclase n=1 Tax=Marinicella litoralis TaxID=644220 RepID=A0A4R6XK57_9GAMM|nr:GGDEF domain-containing protein [Marinicella litoralis]TDR16358.1 diguanylate cyclase (GGDEF)-like protein [Marinicella litoralis]
MKRAKKILQYQQNEFSVLNKSALWLGNVALVFITPFAINNFINGPLNVAVASFIVTAVFLFNTFTVLVWKKYYSNISFFVLSPVILLFCYFSIPAQGIIGVLWSFPGIICFYYLLPERQAWLINIVAIVLCTYLSFNTFDHGLALRISATLSLISAFTAVSIRQINKQQFALHRLAITDSLTGLYNRSTLNDLLNDIIDSHHKMADNSHLMTIDIDHFKKINDQFGHDQGDEVLTTIGHSIRNTVKDYGIVFRYGGEEFIVVIEELPWEKTKRLAEQIRLAVSEINMFPELKVSVSIGLSRLKPKMTRIDWIRESDRNLYTAKKQGRNQVISS